MSSIKPASGCAMPLLGLGTWELRGAKCTEVVVRALVSLLIYRLASTRKISIIIDVLLSFCYRISGGHSLKTLSWDKEDEIKSHDISECTW